MLDIIINTIWCWFIIPTKPHEMDTLPSFSKSQMKKLRKAQRDRIICPRSPLSPEDSHSALVCNLWKHASWFTLYIWGSGWTVSMGWKSCGKHEHKWVWKEPLRSDSSNSRKRWAEKASVECDKWVIRSHLRANLILCSWTLAKMAMASSTRGTGKQSPDHPCWVRGSKSQKQNHTLLLQLQFMILEVWAGTWKSEF